MDLAMLWWAKRCILPADGMCPWSAPCPPYNPYSGTTHFGKTNPIALQHDPLLAQQRIEKLDRLARRVGAGLDQRADVAVGHRREHLADALAVRGELRVGRHLA